MNGDGEIDVEEMRKVLLLHGLPCSPAYVKQMVQQFSSQGNAVVT